VARLADDIGFAKWMWMSVGLQADRRLDEKETRTF
jgi:hypothetical protein